MLANPYQAAVVKRQTGTRHGGGVAVRKQMVKHPGQASAADLILVAGHSLRLHQTPMEDQCFGGICSTGNSGTRKHHALETLLCPRAGLLKAAGYVQRHS